MERVGEVRQWPRPRWLWTAATGAWPRERERRGKRELAQGRARVVRGGAWRRAGVPGDEGEKQEVAGRVAARTERVPLSSWREEGDDWHGQLAGPAYWAVGPGQAAQ